MIQATRLATLLSVTAGLVLSACGGGGGSGSAPITSFTPEPVIIYRADALIDETFELFATTRDGDGKQQLTQASFGGGIGYADFKVSPDGVYLAFINEGEFPGTSELYVDDLTDTSPPYRVSGDMTPGGNVTELSWSPTSERLAYLADQENDDQYELYTVDADGSGLVKVSADLVDGGDVSGLPLTVELPIFAWSPNGTRLAYLADQEVDEVFELYTVLASGLNNLKISGDMVAGGNVTGFKWSPNSQRILYRADQESDGSFELYSAHVSGLITAKINSDLVAGGDVQLLYDWSHDGTHIAYLADQNTNDKYELYVAGFLGANKVKVNNDSIKFANYFSWSPSENRIIYSAQNDDSSIDLFSALASGAQHFQLNDTTTPTDSLWPFAWSPDGERVAYVSDPDTPDQHELYTITRFGTLREKINRKLVDNGDVKAFSWSPDSQRIAYVADQDTDTIDELYAATHDGESLVKLNRQIEQGGGVHTTFKWSRDSLWLAYMATGDGSKPSELYTVSPKNRLSRKVSTELIPEGDVIGFQWRW